MENEPPPSVPPPWRDSDLIRTFVVTGPVFALALTLGAFTQALSPVFGIWFTEIGIFFGVSWWMVRWTGRDPGQYTGLRIASGWAPLFGFLLGTANFFALIVPIQFLMQLVTPKWLLELNDMTRIFKGQAPFEVALVIAGVGLAAPFSEEFFFRGVIQRGLASSSRIGVGRAIFLTAFVFALSHFNPPGFPALLELGLLFGLLYWRTGSIWPGACAHAANNLVSTALYFLAGDQSPESSTADAAQVLQVAAFGGLVLLLLLYLARRFPQLLARRGVATPD